MKVYPRGYNALGSPAEIERLMQEAHMLLIDTRTSTKSWREGWREAALRKRWGKRYRVAGQFLGNIYYYDEKLPIVIADLDTGVSGLIQYLREGHDLILLCACVDYAHCHRKVIVESLLKRLPEVEVVQPLQQVVETVKQESLF